MSNASDFIIENGVLKNYTGTAMDIIIPESVIAIDKRAFWHCSEKLQSITLSAGITIIPEYAFSDCENLQSVTLPESLTVIGSYAFWNCRNLQSITIPEGVISIDAHAFDSCDNLQHVTIPESVTTIRQWAFDDCEKLTIHAPRGSFAEAYAKRKRIPFLAEKREKTIANGQGILLGKAIVVTGDLEYFPEDGPYPQRIKFRNLVEKHGGKLTSSISGKTSYLVCNNRRSGMVKVRQAREKNIPIITENEFLAMLGESRMLEGFEVKGATLSSYHGTATELVIPEWVTDIADWTFSNCENLQSITIPETVERMGDEVFYGCDNLRCITLLGKVQDGVAFGVPRNQTLELVAPNVPLAIWKRYGLMFVAGLGFLTHRKLYTNAAIVAEYEKYIEPRYKKAMEQLWKTDPVEAVQFYAEKGKIRPANFAADYLEPAQKANATQCVTWLLNWQNEHITPEMREKQWQREMKALTNEKAPTIEELRKLWDYSVHEDGTICLGRYKGVDPNVCVPKRIGKQRVTAIGNWTFFHKRKLQSVAIFKNITSIGEGAFSGCENLTIHAPKGSVAEKYAKAHNIPFVEN